MLWWDFRVTRQGDPPRAIINPTTLAYDALLVLYSDSEVLVGDLQGMGLPAHLASFQSDASQLSSTLEIRTESVRHSLRFDGGQSALGEGPLESRSILVGGQDPVRAFDSTVVTLEYASALVAAVTGSLEGDVVAEVAGGAYRGTGAWEVSRFEWSQNLTLEAELA